MSGPSACESSAIGGLVARATIRLNPEGLLSASVSGVQRVTGRWAISWQVIVFANLLTYPQMVLTGGTLGSRQMPAEDIPVAAVVFAVTVLANAAYGTLAMFTIFRHRATRPVPLWLYVSFYLSAGIIPVLGMEYLDSILGRQTALPIGLRLFFACLTTLWLGVIFSLLLEGRDRFRRERAELLDEAVALRSAAIQESESAQELRHSVDALVNERLSAACDQLDQVLVVATEDSRTVTGRRDWVPVVSALESTAQESVRPLSHEMWNEADSEFARPRAGRVFAQMWRDPRFMPGNTALITAVGLAGVSVRGFGAWAPLAIVLVTVVAWALLLLANAALTRTESVVGRRIEYSTAVIIVLLVLLAYSLLPGDVTTPASDAGSIVIAFSAGVLLVSYVQALGDVRRLALASIQTAVVDEQIDAEARRAVLAAVTRQVAKELHGPVQTRLVACAAAIDAAQRTGDTDIIVRALAESAQVIAEIRSGSQIATEPLGDQVERLVSQWRAVCPVDLTIDPDLGQRTDLSAVGDVVEEALANAYRHGQPSRIEVYVQADGLEVVVEVRDDGIGPTDNQPGLGSRLLAASTGGRCSLERSGDWTVLTARISPGVRG